MRIDYALIADYAEINGGKLYVMGGGWDTFRGKQVPMPVRVAVAVGVRLEWEETNSPVPVRVTIEDEDGQGLIRADGTLNVGRPPHLPPGSSQLAQVAMNLQVILPAYRGYRVQVTAGEGDSGVTTSLPFRLVPPA
ncbi:MAG: DUF6941 family protein [Tepidiformaceae bacterium]